MTEALRSLAIQLQALIRAVVRRQGLSPTQAQILLTLPVDGLPLSELAQRLGLDASTITRVTSNMATAGLVKRRRSTTDRRVFLIAATAKGRELHQQLQSRWEQEVRAVLDTLKPERRESLGRDLEELSWLLLRYRAGGGVDG
ncbi:MAG: MarR family transcriptional regulator [Candidatus Neomarinimicrobiota bacterium]